MKTIYVNTYVDIRETIDVDVKVELDDVIDSLSSEDVKYLIDNIQKGKNNILQPESTTDTFIAELLMGVWNNREYIGVKVFDILKELATMGVNY